jgi:hypothetical protein
MSKKQDYNNRVWKPLLIGGIILFVLFKMNK